MRNVVVLSLLLATVACEDSPIEAEPSVATSITLTPTSVTLSALGSTQALTATVKDQGPPRSIRTSGAGTSAASRT